MNFYYLMFRRGMTGGTARSVYKLLCSSEGWENQHAQGGLDLSKAGIQVASISWLLTEASSEQEAIDKIRPQVAEGWEILCISQEEAIRIEKGEKVTESPGKIDKKIMEEVIKNLNADELFHMINEVKDHLNNKTNRKTNF